MKQYKQNKPHLTLRHGVWFLINDGFSTPIGGLEMAKLYAGLR